MKKVSGGKASVYFSRGKNSPFFLFPSLILLIKFVKQRSNNKRGTW